MNQIASTYLEGCINQTVAGVCEIGAFAEIAQKPTITEKLEAAQRIVIQDTLKEFIAKLPKDKAIGFNVEIEGGNALLRQVHFKLLAQEKIDQPWLGVPVKIAYEGAIKSWLTKAIIDEAYAAILEKLDLNAFELKELMALSANQVFLRSFCDYNFF